MENLQANKVSAEDTSGEHGKQSPESFRIAEWSVDPATGRVSQGDQVFKLEPKIMAVLVYLAQRPGEVVSREELEDAVWKGTVVGYNSVTGAIRKLRKVFGDDPKHARIIETLSKRGYRIVASVLMEGTTSDRPFYHYKDKGPVPERKWLLQPSLAALVALLLVITGLLLWTSSDQVTRQKEVMAQTQKSIVVIPFDNLAVDSEQEYFVDGITDDLTTELAKSAALLVISRESAFLYKDQPLDIREIADELGVRFILYGNVRRMDENTRVNVHLIDTETGSHLWTDSYDLKTEDIFELRKEITRKVFTALGVTESIGEQQDFGAPPTGNFQAYDSFLKGRQRFYLFSNSEENSKARDFFQQALDYDPDFALAYAMLAWTHVFDVMNGWSPAVRESLAHARELADKAISLQQVIPIAYFVKGLAYRENGEYMSALVEAEKAIEYDPNYANAHVLLATLLYYAGRPQEGLERIRKAMQLNPHHPHNYTFHLGQAYYILQQYEEAINAFRKGISSNPTSERIHLWLVATYAQIGDIDRARWETEQILSLNPDFSLDRLQHTFPFKHQSDREHFLDGLRKAGLH